MFPPIAAASARSIPTQLTWDQIKTDMKLHEALVKHMYLDSRDFVTVGIGNMLPSLAAAQALSFVLRGEDQTVATKEQIKTDWDAVKALTGKNKRATSFAKVTQLDLKEEDCWALLKKRIDNDFLPSLKKQFRDWETIPTPAKRALLDMIYNLGPERFKRFKTMLSQVGKKDWEKAAAACTRKGVPDDRNEWTKNQFLEAAALNKALPLFGPG